MKIHVHMVKYTDGTERPCTHDLFALKLEARIAQNLVASMSGVDLTNDASERHSPRAIAVRACDIAQQLVHEMQEREWIMELPPVRGTEETK